MFVSPRRAGYEPNSDIVEAARRVALETGGEIELFHSPEEAVSGRAGDLYRDVWASMGQARMN